MNSFTQSSTSSAVPSISGLDAYTVRDYHFPATGSYMQPEQDEFGFDPPGEKPFYSKFDPTYWPGFEREDDHRQKAAPDQTYPIDKLICRSLPNAITAISRYGQVTPPRTNSPGSVEPTKDGSRSPSTKGTERPRRKTKPVKVSELRATTATGRKRKNSRKATANAESSAPQDDKRKASLEKNRLAAAKCRVNKKEKTEQLQRDSHDKAVENAYLKGEVIRMKEEIQQLNAILLAHTSCESCKSPEEIQKLLQELTAEYLPYQIGLGPPDFQEYTGIQLDCMPLVSQGMDEDSYFAMALPDSSMVNPPLPEFNRPADFEVHTPLQTD